MEHIYRSNKFFDEVRKMVLPKENMSNCPIEKMAEFQKEKKQQLAKLLRLADMQNQLLGEISWKKEENFEALGEDVERYTYTGIKGLNFLFYKIVSKNPNGKAVLYLHGHDHQGVYGCFNLKDDGREHGHKSIAIKMARLGYTVYIPELIGQGEATYTYMNKTEEEQSCCFLNTGYLAMLGYNIAGFRVFQSGLIMDVMEQEGFEKASLFGYSGGGLIAMLFGVLEDRIERIMLNAFTNSWVDSVLAKEQCVDNYIPGIMEVGESYEILSLVAPRVLFTINGTGDRPFPRVGSEKAFAFLKDVYARMEAEDKYTGYLFEGRHEVNADETLNWLKNQK